MRLSTDRTLALRLFLEAIEVNAPQVLIDLRRKVLPKLKKLIITYSRGATHAKAPSRAIWMVQMMVARQNPHFYIHGDDAASTAFYFDWNKGLTTDLRNDVRVADLIDAWGHRYNLYRPMLLFDVMFLLPFPDHSDRLLATDNIAAFFSTLRVLVDWTLAAWLFPSGKARGNKRYFPSEEDLCEFDNLGTVGQTLRSMFAPISLAMPSITHQAPQECTFKCGKWNPHLEKKKHAVARLRQQLDEQLIAYINETESDSRSASDTIPALVPFPAG
jgi:hypothetical protein